MKRLITIAWLAIGLILAVSSLAGCQDLPNTPPLPIFVTGTVDQVTSEKTPIELLQDETLQFEHLTLEQGLSQSTVNAILQDEQGFMWFGTQDGLNRYDGYEFEIFRHDTDIIDSISDNSILTLFQDSIGRLWIGTEGGGLNQYSPDTETFISYRSDPDTTQSLSSDTVLSITEDNSGNIWLGTSNGLNRFDPERGIFNLHRNNTDPTSENHGANYVTAIHESRDKKLWLGTLGGLFSYDLEKDVFTRYGLVGPPPLQLPEGPPEGFERVQILTIFEDDKGNIWVGTRGEGLIVLDPTNGQARQFLNSKSNPRSLSNNTISSIAQDNYGTLWLGTVDGLNRMVVNREEFINYHHVLDDPQSLSDSEIRSVFIDEAGLIWAGTNIGGINKYDPLKIKFRHIKVDRGDGGSLSDPQVWTFYEDRSGIIWIGTSNGLNQFNPQTGLVVRYYHNPNDPSSFSNNSIRKIFGDSNGRIWLATEGGLDQFLPGTSRFTHYFPDPEDDQSISSLNINTLHEDNFGYLWIGTNSSGLDRLNPNTGHFDHFIYQEEDKPTDSLPANSILSFFEDNETLWIGTAGGLAKYSQDSHSFTYFRHDPNDPQSIIHDVVHAIHKDSAGRLWIGTRNGLELFEPESEQFIHFREKDGLPNNTIMGILEDSSGNLWLSTNRGLSRFDPETNQFRNYDTSDGLQSLEFNRGASFIDNKGQMFFGGINGFNYFLPEEVADNPYLPPVVITKLQIDNQSVPIGPDSPLEQTIYRTSQLDLSRNDSIISFELASLHYSNPGEIEYAYVMEGFDNQWNYIGHRRFATYTKLPPGKYVFHAIATNSDGVWNSVGASLGINIPYPFWQTWWFAAIAAIAVGALIGSGYWLRVRNIAARTSELESQVAARTAEIEKRRQIAEGLREILILLNSNQSLEESLHYIVTQAARLTDAEDVIIFRRDTDVPMRIVATNPGGQIRYSAGQALQSIINSWEEEQLQNKLPIIIPDLVVYWLQHPEIGTSTIASHKAILGIPLLVGEAVFGGLVMFYTEERSFSDDDLDLGFTFTDQATLAIANAQLREQAEETAIAEERSRLARELHDAVTQTIFSASLIAETVAPIWEVDRKEAQKLLKELRQLTRGALAEMRTLLLELRPAALEEAQLKDLVNQLAEAVAGRSGIPVSTQVDISCQLPNNVKVALYRIAQESLNNVVKHSRATEVEVSLTGIPNGNGVILKVTDNGRGFDPESIPADRLGISIIRERSQAIGGILNIVSCRDSGTRIEVTWKRDNDDDEY